MGATQSKDEKKIVVAKTNSNAPEILRLFNVSDHLFPYKLDPSHENRYPLLKMSARLNEFNDTVERRLNVSPRINSMNDDEMKALKTIESECDVIEEILTKGEKVKKIISLVSKLEHQVYLCRHFVVEICSTIHILAHTRIFQVCCNYLMTIPPEIGCLQELRVLILARNRINRLPEEIGLLRKLKELNLSQNELKDLPKSIISLKKLEALHLDGNKFKEIPVNVGRLASLKYLNVSKNKIKFLPVEILQLPNVSEIDFNNCDFKPNEEENDVSSKEAISLKEICARHIVRNNLNVYRHLCKILLHYILSVQVCSFCTGPFFDNFYLVKTKHEFLFDVLPVQYRMCCSHFKSRIDKHENLFKTSQKTFPSALYKEELPPISELFCSYNFDKKQMRKFEKSICCKKNTVPLISLARFNILAGGYKKVENNRNL